jgi:hypothetical protein
MSLLCLEVVARFPDRPPPCLPHWVDIRLHPVRCPVAADAADRRNDGLWHDAFTLLGTNGGASASNEDRPLVAEVSWRPLSPEFSAGRRNGFPPSTLANSIYHLQRYAAPDAPDMQGFTARPPKRRLVLTQRPIEFRAIVAL